MRQNQKKLISLLLLLAMLFTIVPAAAFAGTENNQTATISIIADSNSTVQLFAQQYERYPSYYEPGYYDSVNYYKSALVEPSRILNNQDGTKTYYFEPNQDIYLSYRVSRTGYITKAGYVQAGDTVSAVYTSDDRYTESVNSTVAPYMENGLLLNANGQNCLQLAVGETYCLRAYRTWQIVDGISSNIIIEPDFHYNIVSGNDVVSVTPISTGNASGNWMNIAALKAGTAILEISYDAIDISGGSYPGIYGATDTTRTGLLVIQVGDGSNPYVDFKIDSYSSNAITYSLENAQPWDSEFDTLYFEGESGTLTLSPVVTTGSGITVSKVEISNDKGTTWTELYASDDKYTADIVAGNNMLRVTKSDSTTPSAYQVVRGEQVSIKVTNQTHPGQNLETGDIARVVLNGLHLPVMKMAGFYNPAMDYPESEWGAATYAPRLSYQFGDVSVSTDTSVVTQYELIATGNYVDVTVPIDSINLTEGYISSSIYGGEPADDTKNHRMLKGNTEYSFGPYYDGVRYTRSILPEITVTVGLEPSENTAPIVADPCFSIPSIFKGESYNVSLSNLFYDADHDTLTYQVSVNGGEAIAIDGEMYLFQPTTAGDYTLIFMASDGQESVSYKTTVTVKTSSSGGSGSGSTDINFDMNGKEIAGYVTLSFEDNAKRPVGSKVANSLGTIIGATEVPYANGESVAAVTLRLLDAKGIQANYNGSTSNGFYLAAIQNFRVNGVYYSSLGEFDAGSGSGWMYSVNGEFPQIDASSYDAESGAVICWKYTSALGEDVGSSTSGGSASSSTAAAAAQAATGKEVAALIEKIGTVQKDSGELLSAIRAAYDKLSDAEKKLVENYDALLAAEQQYSRLTSPLPFQDVSETHWAHDAIQYLYSQSLMGGTGDAAFSPEASLSRGMLVTILYRLEGEPKAVGNNDFADVTDRAWYSNAVLWASANGIVSGYGGGQFGPDDAITREQLAAMLMRYAQYKQYDTSKASSLTGYADAAEISSWAESALAWANAEGLITGRSSTALAPRETVTRAETAAILMRYLQKIVIEPVK